MKQVLVFAVILILGYWLGRRYPAVWGSIGLPG